MIHHALDPSGKRARREAILDAARALFVVGDGSLPSAAAVATAAGLAKGTVYLYFATKGEIFAALLLADWGRLMDDVATAVTAARGSRRDKVQALLAAYAEHLDRHPDLLRLDALGHGVLERNLSPPMLRDFKLALTNRLVAVGAAVDVALRLPDTRGLRLLMRTHALTRGLWQSSGGVNDPALTEAAPALVLLAPDFPTELRDALAEYWRGALAPLR